MSATIGNVNEVCSFLDATVYSKNFRPVELTEYVKCSNEIARINWNHEDESDLLVEHKKVDFNVKLFIRLISFHLTTTIVVFRKCT